MRWSFGQPPQAGIRPAEGTVSVHQLHCPLHGAHRPVHRARCGVRRLPRHAVASQSRRRNSTVQYPMATSVLPSTKNTITCWCTLLDFVLFRTISSPILSISHSPATAASIYFHLRPAAFSPLNPTSQTTWRNRQYQVPMAFVPSKTMTLFSEHSTLIHG